MKSVLVMEEEVTGLMEMVETHRKTNADSEEIQEVMTQNQIQLQTIQEILMGTTSPATMSPKINGVKKTDPRR